MTRLEKEKYARAAALPGLSGGIGALTYTQKFRTPTDSTHLCIMGRNLLFDVLEGISGKCKY